MSFKNKAANIIIMIKIKKGFTIIELLVTITISVILAIITVPSMMNWYQKDQFIQKSRIIIDTINDARAAATADKKCSTGDSATGWSWNWTGNEIIQKVSLKCHYYVDQNNENIEENVIDIDKEIIEVINDGFFYNDDADISSTENISILFDAGRGTSSISVETSDTFTTDLEKYDIKNIRLPFRFVGDNSIIRTICFDRIANLPTISPDLTCND